MAPTIRTAPAARSSRRPRQRRAMVTSVPARSRPSALGHIAGWSTIQAIRTTVQPAGSEIHDTATLTGAVSPVGALTFKLYGPDDATCASAPIFNATIGFTGGGQHNSPGFTPAVAGTYRWVVSYSGARNNEPAGPTRCGEASETVTLTKAQPAISPEA